MAFVRRLVVAWLTHNILCRAFAVLGGEIQKAAPSGGPSACPLSLFPSDFELRKGAKDFLMMAHLKPHMRENMICSRSHC